jgi:hypothetical protein
MSSKEDVGNFFRGPFRVKATFIILLVGTVIYLLIVLSTHVQYIYIHNFIVFTLITAVLLYLYLFCFSSGKLHKIERLVFGPLVGLLMLFFTLYIFSFIHEMSHALVAISRGVPKLDFMVGFGKGEVYIPDPTSNLDKSMISIAGSFSVIIVNAIIIGVISTKNNLPFEIFLSIFLISGREILSEIEYWMISIINNSDDAAVFLSVNPSINPSWLYQLCYFVFKYLWIVLMLLLSYKIINKTVFLNIRLPDMNFDFFKQFNLVY